MACKMIEEVFNEGKEEGRQEVRAEIAGRLLIESDWPIEKIARIVELPVDKVRKLKVKLESKR
ncbi:hypothetical protein [Allobaculum sp. JKK-2023]|uniref:hypothetical protein n=1 Tax=Allobaculum sp. JKK-2023 TaxID=3108943 RepID=UPI002B05EC3C|nr:hypothetical protein [Allobaculum sp. JKK-2023]